MVMTDAKGGNKSNKKKLQIPQAIPAAALSREMLPVIVSYVYIFLPVVLFALMWTKIFIGLPVAAVIVYGLYRSCISERPSALKADCEKDKGVKLVTAAALVIIVLWVLTSGIGGSVVQYPDHLYRNAVYKILVDNPWPVRMESADGDMRGLVYYIGFWLPAALVAKAASYEAGFFFQQIWAVIGLFLIWHFICEKQGKRRLWFLAVFIFFGGADFIGYMLGGRLFADVGNRMEWWAVSYNYPGFSTQLFWAFNQVIYGWLIYCLIDRQTDNKRILYIWSAALLTCPFPAAGMIPFALLKGYENADDSLKPAARLGSGLKESLTLTNGAGLIVSLFTAGYVLSNMAFSHTAKKALLPGSPSEGAAADKLSEAGNTVIRSIGETANGIQYLIDPELKPHAFGNTLWLWLMFCLLEFGLFFFAIYMSQGKRPVYWLCLAVLMLCPLIKIGYGVDFCMRVSIPALLCLYEMVISAAGEYCEKKKYAMLSLLLGLLLIGSIATFDTLYGTMSQTIRLRAKGRPVTTGIIDERAVMTVHNFSSGMDSFFYKYMAR